MARNLSRRGRMKSEDERRMQINSLYIEHEVDARDLAGLLYASETIDCNDRDEILGGCTRRERTRRMIDILLLRGTDAFEVFLNTLDQAGYDHVASRLRAVDVIMTPKMTPKNSLSDFDAFLRGSESFIREASAISLTSQDPGLISERLKSFEATCLNLTGHDPGSLAERLKKIEDLWNILSRRVTRIEQRVDEHPATASTPVPEPNGRVTAMGQIGEEELNSIKNELADLKKDTIVQVEDLTSANTQKAAIIENLMEEVEQKTAQLQGAQSRIEELEQRIERLETEKAQSMEEVGNLREELEQHKQVVQHQEEWFNAENLRMKNKMLQQENVLRDLQEEKRKMGQKLEEQHEDLKDQRSFMEEQLSLLNKKMQTLASSSGAPSNTAATNIVASREAKKTELKPQSGSEPDQVAVVGDIIGALAAPRPASNVSSSVQSKPNTAQPSNKGNLSTNKSNFSNHRTTFNCVTSTSQNVSNQNIMTVSNTSNTVSLSVPTSANLPPHSYRGRKRSATMFRSYNRKK